MSAHALHPLIRGLFVVVAAVAIGFGIAGLRQTNRCDDAKQAIDVVIYQRSQGVRDQDPREIASTQRKLVADCRDRTELARYATLEGTVGLTAPAASLARTVTRLEPTNRFGWLALALVLNRVEPAAADAARRRAHALDPRGVPLP
jgi:Flp pilus assembly protein TadD